MQFNVYIKAGTCGYDDYDSCDMMLQSNIATDQLPNKYDNILLYSNGGYTKYLVTDVCRTFYEDKEFNTVYVIKV
jgi:hypothetical protein